MQTPVAHIKYPSVQILSPDLAQFISSSPVVQSATPSHTNASGMQTPVAHIKKPSVQITSPDFVQFFSSSPVVQSATPSQTKSSGIQVPSAHPKYPSSQIPALFASVKERRRSNTLNIIPC